MVSLLDRVLQDLFALLTQGRESRGKKKNRYGKSWHQLEGCDLLSLRYFKRVSGKRKDHRLEKNVQHLRQRSPITVKCLQRCVLSKAWNLASQSFTISKKKTKTAFFFFPAEEWILPAASTKELEERKFVNDIQERVCIWEVIKTSFLLTSRSPTTEMTINDEMQTREEIMVYVKLLGLFVIYENHGYNSHWFKGQKLHLISNDKRIIFYVSNCVSLWFLIDHL